MQSKSCRLLFSSLLKTFSHSPQSAILLPYNHLSTLTSLSHHYHHHHHHLFLPFLSSTHFSTIPNRPLRREKPDDRSSEDLLRRFDLDDGDDGDENMKGTRPMTSTQSSKRPMRGETRDNRLDDFFLRKFDPGSSGIDDVGRAKSTHQDFPAQIPKRPMRGENRDGPHDLFTRKFKIGNDVADDITEKSQQNASTQMPNRPMKGEKRGDQSDDLPFQKFEHDGDIDRDKMLKKAHQNRSSGISETEAAALDSSLHDADEIFKKMKETGLIPNAVAMLDGLCKDGLIQEAMKLFGLMREKGTIPEVVIYTAVVEGFCQASKFDDAKRIFRKMQNNGISPNAFSYKVLIQGLCKGGKLKDAIDFCIEMLEAGHSPNVVTFVGLIDGFCREKGVEEAKDVIGRLKEKGFAIDEKAVREHLDKRGPFSPSVWEVIFGNKSSQKLF